MTPLLLAAAIAATAADPAPKTGAELIHTMQARYAGRWYRTLTFVQTTTFADGRIESWHEALAMPGRLRIDIAGKGITLVFRNDSAYQFRDGALTRAVPQRHPLLILGFDVYHQEPAVTIAALTALGFDLARIRQDEWQGRPVWVVGADAGDGRSAQFWVDQEHLYFVRMLTPNPQQAEAVSEVQFNKYRRAGGGWIAPEVVFLSGGTQQLLEEYHQIAVDVPVADTVFSVSPFTAGILLER